VRTANCWAAPATNDGSGLRAEEFLDLLIEKGSDAVWAAMDADYEERFGVA